MDWAEKINEWDSLLVKGQFEEVKEALDPLALKKVPKEYLKNIAQIARRSGAPEVAIKLFSQASQNDLSDEEIVEYCHSLAMLDLHDNVALRLEEIKGREVPDIFLLRASGWFREWDYEKALPELESYVNSDQTDEYQKAIGETNICAVHIFLDDFDRADSKVEKLIEACQAQGWWRLLANAFDMKSQMAAEKKDWKSVRCWLEKQERLIEEQTSLEGLYSFKLDCLCRSYEENNPSFLEDFKARSLEQEQWEMVRYADYQLAKFHQDKGRWNHVYFGTPFPSFRKKLRNEWNDFDESYIAGESTPYIDLASGEIVNGDKRTSFLKFGQKLHRLLIVLNEDFYKPLHRSSIFEKLHRGEVFDDHSSVNKVHQTLSRLRQSFEDFSLPFEISEAGEKYRFVCKRAGIKKSDSLLEKPEVSFADQLQKHFTTREFTARDVAIALDISSRYAVQQINDQIKMGSVEKFGRGRATSYRNKVPGAQW